MRARLVCLAAAGVLAMLAASRAHAGWREVTTVTERPNHVLDVWDDGTFSLGFVGPGQGGAYLFVDGGVARKISDSEASASVGTYYQPDADCFVSIQSNGQRTSRGADGGLCGGINPSPPINFTDEGIQRVKHAVGGGVAVATYGGNQHSVLLSDAGLGTPTATFTQVVRLEQGSDGGSPLAVARVGNSVFSFIGVAGTATEGRWGSFPSRSQFPWVLSGSDAGSVQAVELFAVQSVPVPVPYALVGARRAFLQGSLNGSGHALQVVQRLDAGQEIVALSMNVGEGSDAGRGFGMALVTQADGGTQVMSPVPSTKESLAGTVWRPRTIPPGIPTAKLRQVACYGAAFCAFTAPGETTHNLVLYSNNARPQISVRDRDGGVGSAVEVEEDSGTRLTILGTDGDDDPVLLSASYPTDAGWVKPVPSASSESAVTVDVSSTGRICKTSTVGFIDVSASDGLAAHDVQQSLPVIVRHTRRPEIPTVVGSDGGVVNPLLVVELAAGGAPLTLDAVGDRTTAGCELTRKSWTRVSTDGPALTQNGSVATLVPPRFFCEAAGRTFQFQLEVQDEGGLSSSQRFLMRQNPWGAPEPVFKDGAVQRESAGTPVEVLPQGTHGCVNAPGFPGLVTTWDVVNLSDGGSGMPGPEFSIQTPEGEPVRKFPVVAKGLVFQATSICQPPTQVKLSASHAVAAKDGGVAERGEPSEREFLIAPAWPALTSKSLQVSLDESAQALWVDSTIECKAERALHADLRLEPENPSVPTRTERVTVPGGWSLTELECGNYQLHATLEDSAGSSVEQEQRLLVLPGRGVSLEPRPQSGMKAVCGEGASVSLASLVTPTPGFCQTPDYTWTYQSALELEEVSEPDGTVRLATRTKDLDALLGGSVQVGVTASKGPARTELSFDVPISVDPFVRVERRTELPVASETGLVGVLVDLTNTTACDVSGVRYVEHLEGLAYVEGSATLDGEPVTARWEGNALQVEGLLLPGGATRTLSYVARPHLVGERRMWGEASKGDVLLSFSEASEPRPSGCGCASAESGPLLFVLAAMGAALRRRRR